MRRNLARMAYRQLEPRVQIVLIAQFLVCFAGAVVLAEVLGSMRGALAIMALPFVSQALVFGAIRFHAPLAERLSRGVVDRGFALLFASASALIAVLLLFFAARS